jgi:shikimate dehydrogenase
MNISGKTKICVIIGNPIEHTLSPKMHNAAYKALGIDDQFVFVATKVKLENIKEAVKAVRVMGIRGLTCTIPHKIKVLKYLDQIEPVAKKIGAVNTVVNDGGILKGYNTDWLGAISPLEQKISLKNKKVALIGAGGAARAIAFGIVEKEASLKIYNRTLSKAQKLARELKVKAGSLKELKEVKQADIIINATSLGMAPDDDKIPLPPKYLTKNQIVMDAVYIPYKTKFLKQAEKKGCKIIPGIEMLWYQGIAQFAYYTHRQAPEKVMLKVLLNHFGLKKES